MLLSILICCRIFHRFLCKGYARRIRLSFVGMSKEKKRGLADERASERESEQAKERTNKTLLVWEHCSVATTRHGRMSSRVVGADTIESYALNFSPRAYRESKLKVPRLLWLRDSWETKSLTELETFRVCQNFTFYPPNYSKIFVRALFFFFFFSSNQYYLLHLYSPVFQVRSTFYVNQVILSLLSSRKSWEHYVRGTLNDFPGLRASLL